MKFIHVSPILSKSCARFPPLKCIDEKRCVYFLTRKKYTKLLWHLRKGNVHFLSSKYHMFPTGTFLFLQQVASKSNFMAIYTAIPYRIGDDEDFFVFLTKTSLASIIDSTKQLDRDLVCFSIRPYISKSIISWSFLKAVL